MRELRGRAGPFTIGRRIGTMWWETRTADGLLPISAVSFVALIDALDSLHLSSSLS